MTSDCGGQTRVLETRATTASSVCRRRGCRITSCVGKVTTVDLVVIDGHAAVLIARLPEFLAQITAQDGGSTP